MDKKITADEYAANIATQLRKGFLSYCVLKVCVGKPQYTSDIITRLRAAELVIVEGTIYPLLSRLHKEGLLSHEWIESEQGPPRKYYTVTKFGGDVMDKIEKSIDALNETVKKL